MFGRKDQLRELIQLNQDRIAASDSYILELSKELKEIKAKESRPVDAQLQEMRRNLSVEPHNIDLRRKVTREALRAEQGSFVAWRGGQASPPGACFLEIEQPLFNSENVLLNLPTITQQFHVLLVDGIGDLEKFLPLKPSGMISLPKRSVNYFHSSLQESVTVRHEKGRNHYTRYQPVYDRNTVASSGAAQLNFFQVPLGGTYAGSATPKSQIYTNMDQGGSFPYPRHFCMTGISVIPETTAAFEDVCKLIDTSWCRFFIGTMDHLITPSNMMVLAPGSKSPVTSFRLSNPIEPVMALPEPTEILPQQNFRFELNFPVTQTFSKSFDIFVILHGFFQSRVHSSDD